MAKIQVDYGETTDAPATAPGINYNQPTAPSPLPAAAAATTPAPVAKAPATAPAPAPAQAGMDPALAAALDFIRATGNMPPGVTFRTLGFSNGNQWSSFLAGQGLGGGGSSGGGATGGGGGTGVDYTSAANSLNSILTSYGLTGGIAAGVTAMLQNGLDITTIQTILDSPDPMGAVKGLGLSPTQLSAAIGLVSSWQTRFSGNQARIAAGLNPLSPAEYIANEQSYKTVMSMSGIPASSPLQSTDYLGKLIAADISPAETQMRVNAATAAVQNEDPQVLAQLQSQFGMTMPTIISHLLDPAVAAPLVQQEYNAATIGAEAARAGVNISYGATGPLSAMGLAAQGVTQAQANQGFANIASQEPAMQSLAGRYQGYGNAAGVGQQLEASTFNTQGAAQAQQNLERLKTQETSAFSGSAGAATGSLGMKDISGLS